MKAGIQGAAGINSEGVSLSLRCPSTLLTEGSHLGSGAQFGYDRSASRALTELRKPPSLFFTWVR